MDNQTTVSSKTLTVGDKKLDKLEFYKNLNTGTPIFLDAYSDSWGRNNTELVRDAILDLTDAFTKDLASIELDDAGKLYISVAGRTIPQPEEGQFNPYTAAAYMITSTAEAMKNKQTTETKKKTKKYTGTTFLENFGKTLSPTGDFNIKYWLDLDPETKTERPYTNRLKRFNQFLTSEISNLDNYDEVDDVFGSKDLLKTKLLDLLARLADGNISAEDNLAFTALGFNPDFFTTKITEKKPQQQLATAVPTTTPQLKPGTSGFLAPDSAEYDLAVMSSVEKKGYDLTQWQPNQVRWYVDAQGKKHYIVTWKKAGQLVVKQSSTEMANQRKPSEDWNTEDTLRTAAIAQDVASVVAAFVPTYGTATAGALGITSLGTNLAADVLDPSVTAGQVLKNVGINAAFAAAGLIPGGKTLKVVKALKTWVPRAVTAWVAAGNALDPEVQKSLGKVTSNEKLTVQDWKNIAAFTASMAGATRMGVAGAKTYMNKGFSSGTTTTKYKIKTKITDAEGKVKDSDIVISQEQRARINKAKTLAEADAELNKIAAELKVQIPEGSKLTLGEGKFSEKAGTTNFEKGKQRVADFKRKVNGEKVQGEKITETSSNYTPEQIERIRALRSNFFKKHKRLDAALNKRFRTNLEVHALGEYPIKSFFNMPLLRSKALDEALKEPTVNLESVSGKTAYLKPFTILKVVPPVEIPKPNEKSIYLSREPKAPEISNKVKTTSSQALNVKEDVLPLVRYSDALLRKILTKNIKNGKMSKEDILEFTKLINLKKWNSNTRHYIRLYLANKLKLGTLEGLRKAAESGKKQLGGKFKDGGILMAKNGTKSPYTDIEVPEWYLERYPHHYLIDWNDELDASAAKPTIIYPGAMHSNALDLRTAYGKNDAYIGRSNLVRDDLQNYANSDDYLDILSYVNAYNKDAQAINDYWKVPHKYRDEATTHNLLFKKLFPSRSGAGVETYDIGYSPANESVHGSSTWLRRMDTYKAPIDFTNPEDYSRIHKITLKNGKTGYVYKKENGEIGVVDDLKVIDAIENRQRLYGDRQVLENSIYGNEPEWNPKIDDREKLLAMLSINGLRAGRLLGDIWATDDRARKLTEALRRINLHLAPLKYHLIMNDYAGNQFAANRAAEIVNRLSRPVTSNGSLQTARQLEGINKAHQILQEQAVRNLDMIQKHMQTAENYANENAAARVQVANDNGDRLYQLQQALANIEQQRSAGNQTSIDNYLMQVEKDAVQNWNDRKAIIENYKLNRLGTQELRIRWAFDNDVKYQLARAAYSAAINETDPDKQLSTEEIEQLATNLRREQARVQKEAIDSWNMDYRALYNLPLYLFNNPYKEYLGTLAKYLRGGLLPSLISASASRANSVDTTEREMLRTRRADDDRFMKSIWKAIDTYLQLARHLRP